MNRHKMAESAKFLRRLADELERATENQAVAILASIDRDLSRFERLAHEELAALPPGHVAPLDGRAVREMIGRH